MEMIIPKVGERVEIASTHVDKAGSLLDVGCGDGVLAYFIKKKVNKIYGIDNDKKMLGVAQKNGYTEVKYVDLDKTQIPYKDNTFDVVTSLDVIEHVYDPRIHIGEIYRVLKRKGKLIITTPNIRFTNHIYELAVKGKFPKTSSVDSVYDGGHIHFFTYKDIEELLVKAGFHNIQHESIINKPRRGWKGRLLESIFGKSLMREFRSQGILTIAKK